jgi:CDP-diacylglycerol--serine O-phosphatidyltransferase
LRRNADRKIALKELKPVLPGLFTFGNLLCGLLALLHSMGDNPANAAWFILIGAFLDSLDGKVARITNSSSEFGLQLDSLADFLTFGIAPVAMMHGVGIFDMRDWRFTIALLYMFAGAFRLARFNVNASLDGADYFTGLPIPMAAVTISSGILFIEKVWPPVIGTGSLGGVALMAWLMVSNVRYTKRLPRLNLSKKCTIFLIIPTMILILALILAPRYIIYPLSLFYIAHGLVRELLNTVARHKENRYDTFQGEGLGSKEENGGRPRGKDD